MEILEAGRNGPPGRRLLGRLVAASFILLVCVVSFILVHAFWPSDLLYVSIEVLAGALGLVAAISVVAGILYSWRVHPQHRRPIIFVIVITIAVLLAHAYMISNPPAGNPQKPVTGAVGTTLFSADKDSGNNSLLTVSSSEVGLSLNLTVSASGTENVADVQLSVSSQLGGPGFAGSGTFASPLFSGSTMTGTWTISAPIKNLTVSYETLNCYAAQSRVYGCIMDEVYYVPAAQHLLAGNQCQQNVGSSDSGYCNLEHPPLGKALIAAGMAVFGAYNAVGWRILPALLGALSIPLLFGIAWKVSGNKKLAYLSAIIFALDVMFFSQSSAGLIDIPEVFFGLAAFFVYVAGLRVWKFDQYILAGVLLGLSALVKETAVFIVFALLTYIVFFGDGARQHRLLSAIKVGLVVALVFIAGLQAYDSAVATNATPTFVQEVSYMLSYGGSLMAHQLACQPTTGYWCKFANDPGGPPILPTDWLLYYSPVTYYGTSVTVCPNSVNGVCKGGAYSYVSIAYYGITNEVVTWTVFVWVPLVSYAIYRQFRKKDQPPETVPLEPSTAPSGSPPVAVDPLPAPSNLSGDLKFGILALVIFVWSYVPYLFLLAAERVTYPFYFIPAIPATSMGAAYWLTRSWFPKPVMYVYLAMVFVFFFVYFPDKGFLPDWLRVLLAH